MLNLLSSVDLGTLILIIIALCFVLFYEAINGFHDTANAIATVIYTRAMREDLAVLMAGFANFFGVLLGGLSVAYAIVHLLPTDILLNVNSSHEFAMVFSILLAAIIWNLGTWYFGIPASSSHTLIGSIIGVAITNAIITKTPIMEALNINKVIQILLSLIISPLVGLLLAGFAIFLLRRFWSGSKKKNRIHMSPNERMQIDGKKKPPFWTRICLILTGAGVSFSHGANDGQKGIGLLMLTLISIAPAYFMININANEYEIAKTRDAVQYIEQYYQQNQTTLANIIGNESPVKAVKEENTHCDSTQSFATLQYAKNLFSGLNHYDDLTPEQRTQTRSLLLCLSDGISKVIKNTDISKHDKNYLKQLRKDLLITVEYAPLWIIVSVALALAVGTMIGWRRVAETIGEKIGKTDMTYAQGVSAQATAAVSIGIASYTGMPVSTTQVLSSAVAGTMIVDGGGVQTKTIKTILLAWLFTLPVSMFLSGSLFTLALYFI